VLSGATAIYCSGTALHHVASAFNLARLLKPAIIVLEDVDLVFSSRDINPSSGALGDLFDHIDAIADSEPICVILTTNAIERVEAAVKDRPGRVSQCIFFGPPSPDLRRRYLRSYLARHQMTEATVDHVVKATEGVTQAFLKELVQRGLRFAIEAGHTDANKVTPAVQDFDAALSEMRARASTCASRSSKNPCASFDSKAARAITGFRS
jgi:cell division protease FtsH